jgi:hypothetical protein
MDSAHTKTWVDFWFYVFDSIKTYILPVLGALLAGWIAPSPQSLIRKAKERVDG